MERRGQDACGSRQRGKLEANLSEEAPGKHQLSRDWTRRNWKYLHFNVIMLFGTYGVWLKESVVPIVNLIRLPKTFSCCLDDVCPDSTEKKKKKKDRLTFYRCTGAKLDGAQIDFDCVLNKYLHFNPYAHKHER